MHLPFTHFKIDTLQSCINVTKKNSFMASLDLSDAYYSVSIHPDSQKYLKFQVNNHLCKFITLPNGLSYSILRTRGHISSGHLDDSFLLGNTVLHCQQNIDDAIGLFNDLGFKVSDEKSITTPPQCLIHVEFVLNSVQMTVSLSEDSDIFGA